MSGLSAKTTLLFDLDGTLIDSAADLTGALNHVMRDMDLPEVQLDDVRHMVGRGARVLIQQGMARAGAAPSENLLEKGFKTFLAYYADHLTDETTVFPGVRETLEQFAAVGCAMAVCTNKPGDMSRQIVRDLELNTLLPVVVGADDVVNRKPHGDHLLYTLNQLNRPANTAVMVGDSEIDLHAGRAAGLPVILVSFGYTAIPAQDLPADILIDDFRQLSDAVARLFPG